MPAARSLFAPENLIAWCIVPFDRANRGPAERMALLQRLGFKQYGWDWREIHVPLLGQEIRRAQEHGIRLRAIWLWIDGELDRPGELGPGNRAVIDTVNAAGLSVEFWTGFHPNYFEVFADVERVNRGEKMVRYLREQAAESGSTVALYNHGDWFGEPANQLRIIAAAGEPVVGMIYNFHHAHHQIAAFPSVLPRMLPYLRGVSVNGMRPEGPKILPVGAGSHEAGMVRALLNSGYGGPVAVLGHVDDEEIETVLQRNLLGLRTLAQTM